MRPSIHRRLIHAERLRPASFSNRRCLGRFRLAYRAEERGRHGLERQWDGRALADEFAGCSVGHMSRIGNAERDGTSNLRVERDQCRVSIHQDVLTIDVPVDPGLFGQIAEQPQWHRGNGGENRPGGSFAFAGENDRTGVRTAAK